MRISLYVTVFTLCFNLGVCLLRLSFLQNLLQRYKHLSKNLGVRLSLINHLTSFYVSHFNLHKRLRNCLGPKFDPLIKKQRPSFFSDRRQKKLSVMYYIPSCQSSKKTTLNVLTVHNIY